MSLARGVRLSEIQLVGRQTVALDVVIGGVPSPRVDSVAVRDTAVRRLRRRGVRRQFRSLLVQFLGVALVVELPEEEEEETGVEADKPDEHPRIVALDEEELEGVDHYRDELDHLQGGEVLLPPEVRLDRGTERREQVVRVHHDVDEGVQETEEGRVTACL